MFRAQIIHGDLKTGNVLLQPNGKAFVAKVADFGLSMQMDTQATHISNVKGGTLTHMSPELMQSNQNSPAADVYAFGILMFELFGGKRAWEGMTPPAIMSTVMQRRRPVFSSSVPVKVVEIATSCWVHNPGDRPSFKEVLHKLDIVIQLHSKGLLVRLQILAPAGSSAVLLSSLSLMVVRSFCRKHRLM